MTPRKRTRGAESKEKLLAVRIPESLMNALNAHADALREETPWVEMSRSDVVRWLLSRALEHELGKPSEPGRGDRRHPVT